MSVAGSTVLHREPIRSTRLAEAKILVEEEYKLNPWKDATDEEWEDWRWQLKNRITKAEQLKLLLSLNDEEVAGIDASKGRVVTAIRKSAARSAVASALVLGLRHGRGAMMSNPQRQSPIKRPVNL